MDNFRHGKPGTDADAVAEWRIGDLQDPPPGSARSEEATGTWRQM